MTRQCLLAVLAVMVVSVESLSAQDPPVKTIPYDGPEIICHILHNRRLKPITTLEEAAARPDETMILVLGAPQVLGPIHEATGGLQRYLNAGGNVLIASDRKLIELDIGITGHLVRAPRIRRELQGYRGRVHSPLVDFAGRDHPLFVFLSKRIATNCASEIEGINDALHDLMFFHDGRGRYMVGSPKDAPPRGRALIIAGHGMFMNAMMLQADNDNFQFTVNVVDWLRDREGSEKRTRALLVIDGKIIDDFDMKLDPPPPPIPLPPPLILAQLFRGMENERKFHFLLEKALDDNLGFVAAILFAVVTILVVMYGFKKFMEARYHLDTTAPAMIEPKPHMGPGAPIEQNQQAILQQGDLYEEARYIVLKWFKQALGVTPQRWHDKVDARFEVHGSFWSCWGLQAKADGVLNLATNKLRTRIDRDSFLAILDTLRELADALSDGRFVLLIDGKNVRQ